MEAVKAGDTVCWASTIRDTPDTPIRNREIFTVTKVSENGRCDLTDATGAKLFNIPSSHLQALQYVSAHSGSQKTEC